MELHLNTQQGIRRKSNQDALSYNDNFVHSTGELEISEIISNDNYNIFTIADGMGGYAGGDFASNYAITEIYKQFANNKNFNITKSLNSIDDELIEISKNDPTKYGMGTTVVSAIIQSNKVKVFNVGDSCLFHITNKSIQKKSIDDNLPGDNKSVITQCIGNFKQPLNIHVFNFQWKLGDYILMLSDGVSDFISEDILLKFVNTNYPNKAKLLCDEAVKLGSNDDVSAMVLKYD
jgi:serine/threonine protein phosphatase PrpC